MIFEDKKSGSQEEMQNITCHSGLVPESHDGKILKQVQDDMSIEGKRTRRQANYVNSLTSCLPDIWTSKKKTAVAKSSKKVAFTLADVFLSHFVGRRKIAFTLAEVLITLGIIGVVAAMTMPALIQQHQKKVIAYKMKQTYSILMQGIQAVDLDFGNIGMDQWSCSDAIGGTFQTKCFGLVFDKIATAKNYGRAESADTTMCRAGKSYPNYPTYDINCENSHSAKLNNGACVTYNYRFWCGSAGGKVIVDVDGPESGPNKVGRDIFTFVYGQHPKRPLAPYGLYDSNTGELIQKNRRDAIQNCKNNRQNCIRLLIEDGWEFKRDYPW